MQASVPRERSNAPLDKAAEAREGAEAPRSGTAAGGLAGSGTAALLAAGLLLVVSAGRWNTLLYPHYLGQIALQCAVLLLLLLWAFPNRSRPGVARRDLILVAPYVAYGLYTVLSCAWAFNSRLALVGGAVQVVFPLVWAIGLGMLLRSREDVRTVLRATFVAGVIAAVTSLCYVARDGSVEAVLQVQGQRNFLAAFLIPPIIIGLAEILSPVLARAERPWRVLQWPRWIVVFPGILAMLASLGMVLTRSIGGALGLAAAGVCLAAMRLSRRQRLVIVAAAFLLVVLSLLVFITRTPAVTAWMMKHSSVATRWFMWQGAVRMVSDRPLTGWGPGNFMLAFADYKPTEPMQYGWLGNFTIYPHNELLLVAAEGGLLALVLYLAGHILVARGVFRFAESGAQPEMRLVGWTLLAAALGMFVHAQVDVMLRFWAPSAMFWTLIGLLIAQCRMGNAEYHHEPYSLRAPHFALRILLFIAVVVTVVGLAVGVVWSGARAEWLLGAGSDGFVRTRAEAAGLSRYVPDYLMALNEKGDGFRVARNLSAAIESYEELERTAPGLSAGHDVRTNTRWLLGELYSARAKVNEGTNAGAAEADLRKSIDWLTLAVRQNPYNAGVRLDLARAMLQASRRNLPAAIAQARAAVEGEPKNAEAHFVLGAFLAEAGQKGEALAELDKAAALCAPSSKLARRIEAVRETLNRKPAPPN